MKRLLHSTAVAVMSIVVAAPGLAYFTVPSSRGSAAGEQISRRSLVKNTERSNLLSTFNSAKGRTRRQAEAPADENGLLIIQRLESRRTRRSNDTVKPGSDRYRILNVPSMNKRGIRRMQGESSLGLPPSFVQTGGYDRPTRRDIRGDRTRDILREIDQSSR